MVLQYFKKFLCPYIDCKEPKPLLIEMKINQAIYSIQNLQINIQKQSQNNNLLNQYSKELLYDLDEIIKILLLKDECPICLEYLSNDDLVLKCNHCFHKACIKDWIKKNPTCPTCRIILN